MIEGVLQAAGTNHIVLGIASLCSIFGFIVSLFVLVKTNKIDKIVKYNNTISNYNKERIRFLRSFEGHRKSILEDNIRTDAILKDILKNVESYSVKFNGIFSICEKVTIWRFKRILRKESAKVDFNDVCNMLAKLSGRLDKKENIKNG